MANDSSVRSACAALSSLLQSGVGLRADLVRMALPDGPGPALAAALERGEALAPALARALDLPEHEARLLEAAERAGTMPAILDAIGEAREEKLRLRRRLLAGLAYPALLLVAASVLLPLPLLFSEGPGAWLRIAAPGAGGVVALLVLLFGVGPRLPAEHVLRRAPLSVLRGLPGVGPRLLYGPAALACDVLGRSLAAGIPVTMALPAALRASGHPALVEKAAVAARRLEAGGTLAEAIERVPAFPVELRRQIALAEVAGKLDTTLAALARDGKDRHRRTLTMLVMATVAAVLLVVGAVVVVGVVTAAQSFYLDRYDSLLKDLGSLRELGPPSGGKASTADPLRRRRRRRLAPRGARRARGCPPWP